MNKDFSMSSTEIRSALSAPFERKDIEFRVCRASQKNKKVSVLAYLTARAIMERLDAVFGVEGWRDEYEVLQNGVKCRLFVKIGQDWISKEDVAAFTNIEALKGAFSDSLKRAGVKYGIGRYLYDLPEHWVEVVAERPTKALLPYHYHASDGLTGFWIEPQLPQWALPDTKAKIPPDLLSLMEELKSANLLTKSKHEYYLNALSAPELSEVQQAIMREQLAMIKLWGQNVAHNPDIPLQMQKNSYLSIINSSESNIEKVRDDLNHLAGLKTGEAA
jgi:hypothetical protein